MLKGSQKKYFETASFINGLVKHLVSSRQCKPWFATYKAFLLKFIDVVCLMKLLKISFPVSSSKQNKNNVTAFFDYNLLQMQWTYFYLWKVWLLIRKRNLFFCMEKKKFECSKCNGVSNLGNITVCAFWWRLLWCCSKIKM